jgi:RNA-directed DNA polymerase
VQYEATVPTIADRVAQTATAMFLEPLVEPRFHPDSYGYRPKKSAHDAVGVCRQRCWKYDWVIDLDVQKFLESSSHCQRVHGGCVEQAGFGLWDQYS